jgi:hypothetical protein
MKLPLKHRGPGPVGLSAKALGILVYIAMTDLNISSSSLSQDLKDGPDSIASGLRELRDAGYLELQRNKQANGLITTSTKVTESGYRFLNELFLRFDPGSAHGIGLLWSQSEGYTSGGLAHLIPRPITTDVTSVEPNHSQVLNQAQSRQSKQESYNAKQKAIRVRAYERRFGVPEKDWTPSDIAYEFGDRIGRLWNIPPWRVTKTRFTPILADFRLKHETNGEIECLMMDRFFETESIDGNTDGNFLMNRFFYRYGELLSYVKRTYRSKDEQEADYKAARELSDRQWAKF